MDVYCRALAQECDREWPFTKTLQEWTNSPDFDLSGAVVDAAGKLGAIIGKVDDCIKLLRGDDADDNENNSDDEGGEENFDMIGS